MYKLVISDDEGKTTVVPLVRDEITIGRKEGNTIRLTERNVSRRHARLARLNGHFIIHDLDSYNGVRINGRRIDDETTLEAGDKVVIGDYVLALQNEDATAITANPSAVAAPPARLVMLTPPAPGAEFALPDRPVRIGRAEDLDVWVNHRSISREHAEIRREGDEVHLIDLESANGVRLNGKEVQEAVLTPGDEIELGQVRFRFVGEGERYSFEADRTVQMDAIVMPEAPTSNKKTMYAGIGIIAVAALVGGAVALTGGGDTDPVVTPIDATNDPIAVPPEVDPELDQTRRLIAATEACVSALRAEDFEAARDSANIALTIDPESGMAQDCLRRASARTGASEQFAEGAEHLEAGRFEDAWMAFDSLPEDSEFRDRPEVDQARVAFMQHYLDAARAAADENRTEARQQLQQVFAVGDDDDELYASARDLEERLASADREDQRRRRNNTSRMDSYHEINMVAAMNTMTITPPDMTVTTMDPPPTAASPQQIMRECNFANRCVAERLERGPKNATTLPFLIEAYRNLGNTAQSRSLMRQYVQRYPSGGEASRYQRMLDAQH